MPLDSSEGVPTNAPDSCRPMHAFLLESQDASFAPVPIRVSTSLSLPDVVLVCLLDLGIDVGDKENWPLVDAATASWLEQVTRPLGA